MPHFEVVVGGEIFYFAEAVVGVDSVVILCLSNPILIQSKLVVKFAPRLENLLLSFRNKVIEIVFFVFNNIFPSYFGN